MAPPALPLIVLLLASATAVIGCSSSKRPVATNVAVGDKHVCATLTDSSIRCLGSSASGQLGNDTTSDSQIPVTVLQLPPAQSVSAGTDHNCALLSDGSVQCWGGNGSGQLGNGTVIDRHLAGQFVGLSRHAIAVTAGRQFSCAVVDDGTAQCWGSNDCGQLGDGTGSAFMSQPDTVLGLTAPALTISAGGQHSCALLEGGLVQCWGCNEYGQLGNGSFTNSVSPTTVNLPRDAVAITAGGNHTCALLDDGSVKCWGAGADGALGIGKTSDTPSPSAVTTLAGRATDVAAGASNSCAIIEGGAVQCWGSNIDGQLGEDATANSASPVTVDGQIQVAEISVGGTRTCVRHIDSSIDCWGEAPQGQIAF